MFNEPEGQPQELDQYPNSFVIPAYPCLKNEVLFLKSFWRAGMVETGTTTVTLNDDQGPEFVTRVKAIAKKVVTYNMPSLHGYIETEHGHFLFSVYETVKRSGKVTSRIRVDGITYPEGIQTIADVIESLNKDFRDSKYWIKIRECYWSQRREEVLDIRKGYPDHAFDGTRSDLYEGVDTDKLLKLFFNSNENVLLTLGEPGTGKTQLIKKTIHDLAYFRDKDLDVVYTKDVAALKSDIFWAEVHDEGADILILDDLDHELTPRTDKKSTDENVVSRLLSFSNGVFPIKTKILITSNVTEQKVDPALIRPGRCLDVLELRPMNKARAVGIWKSMELPEDVFNTVFEGLDTITQAHFMSEVSRVRSDMNRSYLTDPSISIRDRLVRDHGNVPMGFCK